MRVLFVCTAAVARRALAVEIFRESWSAGGLSTRPARLARRPGRVNG